MKDELDPITQTFVDTWLMDVTKTFREAVINNPDLEKHFNGVSAEDCARELLCGAVQDLERYNFDLDTGNMGEIPVRAKLDEEAAAIYFDCPLGQKRQFH